MLSFKINSIKNNTLKSKYYFKMGDIEYSNKKYDIAYYYYSEGLKIYKPSKQNAIFEATLKDSFPLSLNMDNTNDSDNNNDNINYKRSKVLNKIKILHNTTKNLENIKELNNYNGNISIIDLADIYFKIGKCQKFMIIDNPNKNTILYTNSLYDSIEYFHKSLKIYDNSNYSKMNFNNNKGSDYGVYDFKIGNCLFEIGEIYLFFSEYWKAYSNEDNTFKKRAESANKTFIEAMIHYDRSKHKNIFIKNIHISLCKLKLVKSFRLTNNFNKSIGILKDIDSDLKMLNGIKDIEKEYNNLVDEFEKEKKLTDSEKKQSVKGVCLSDYCSIAG